MNMKNMNKKNVMLIVGGLVFVVLIATLTLITDQPAATKSTDTDTTDADIDSDVGETVSLENIISGELVINKSEITTTASFFPHESNGVYMEIIAIRASDDTVRTALNTCQVCYNSGRGYYEQLGDVLICNNCGNQFTIDQIQQKKGGCNPVPITDDMKTEDDDQIIINTDTLVEYEPLFENWKR